MKLSPFPHLPMFVSLVSSIARNTFESYESTAQDTAKMECLNIDKWPNQDRKYLKAFHCSCK